MKTFLILTILLLSTPSLWAEDEPPGACSEVLLALPSWWGVHTVKVGSGPTHHDLISFLSFQETALKTLLRQLNPQLAHFVVTMVIGPNTHSSSDIEAYSELDNQHKKEQARVFLEAVKRNFSFWSVTPVESSSTSPQVQIEIKPSSDVAHLYKLKEQKMIFTGSSLKTIHFIYMRLRDILNNPTLMELAANDLAFNRGAANLSTILRNRLHFEQSYTLYQACEETRESNGQLPQLSRLSPKLGGYAALTSGLSWLSMYQHDTILQAPLLLAALSGMSVLAVKGILYWQATSHHPHYAVDKDHKLALKTLAFFPDHYPQSYELKPQSGVGRRALQPAPPTLTLAKNEDVRLVPVFHTTDIPPQELPKFDDEWLAEKPLDLTQERTVREVSLGLNKAAHWLQGRLSSLQAEQTSLYHEAIRKDFEQIQKAESEQAQLAYLKHLGATVDNFLNSANVWLNEIDQLGTTTGHVLNWTNHTLNRVEGLLEIASEDVASHNSVLSELKHQKFNLSGWPDRLNGYLLGLQQHRETLQSLRRTLELYVPLLTDCQAGSCGADVKHARETILQGLGPLFKD